MYEEILSRLKTKEEVERLREELDQIQTRAYKVNSSGKGELAYGSAIKTALEKSGLGPREFFLGLQKEMGNLRQLRLVLSNEPEEGSLEKIIQWVRQNVGEGVVIDVDADEEILGGAVVEFEGKYMDGSVRKGFDRWWKEESSGLRGKLKERSEAGKEK